MRPRKAQSDQSLVTPITENGIVHTRAFDQAVAYLEEVMIGEGGLYLITGPNQIGKTTVLQHIASTADERFFVVVSSIRSIDVDNLSAILNQVLSINQAGAQDPKALALRYFLKLGTLQSKDKRLILMLDDIEEIHSSGIDLLKALLQMKTENVQLITIVLCGNDQLDQMMDHSYRWGVQRFIRSTHRMSPVNPTQTAVFADSYTISQGSRSIPFTARAKASLHRLAQGVPGVTIELAERAYNIARSVGGRHITASMVNAAVTGRYRSVTQRLTRAGAGVMVVGLLLLVPTILLDRDPLDQIIVEQTPPPQITFDSSPLPAVVATPEVGTQNRYTGPLINLTEDNIAAREVTKGEDLLGSINTPEERTQITSTGPSNNEPDSFFAVENRPSTGTPPGRTAISAFNLTIPALALTEAVTSNSNPSAVTAEIIIIDVPVAGLRYMNPSFVKDIPDTLAAYQWLYRSFNHQISAPVASL